VTVQPAIDDSYFEMDDAYRWFAKRYTKVDPADLMSLSALDPPPGYADLQEERLRKHSKNLISRYADTVEWHHFRIYRDSGPPTLAVVLGMRSRTLIAQGEQASPFESMWVLPLPVTWRVWLYEHRQGRGWVCLDPRDESHEVVRRLRAQMVLEALR